jgi:hypothetical protein
MPFGQYDDFEDCVSQNHGKNDPEAYCAAIEHKITGKWPAEKRLTPREEEIVNLNIGKEEMFNLLTLSSNYILTKEEDGRGRIFTGWGSCEIVDREGDIISMDAIKRSFPAYMERGGHIIDSHSNRIVGEILDYDFKEKGGVESLWVKGMIYDKYLSDDEVWEDIKNKRYSGLSLGGRVVGTPKLVKTEDGHLAHKIDKVEIYEFSVVREPCNQGANIESVNYMAKNLKDGGGINSGFFRAKNFEEIIAGCPSCKEFIKKMEKVGFSREEAKNRLLVKIFEGYSQKSLEDKKENKMKKIKEKEKDKTKQDDVTEDEVADAVEEAVQEQASEIADNVLENIQEEIKGISKRLGKIEKKVFKQDDEEESEEDTEVDSEDEGDEDMEKEGKKQEEILDKALTRVLKKRGLKKMSNQRPPVGPDGKTLSKERVGNGTSHPLAFKEGELGKMNGRQVERMINKHYEEIGGRR